MEIKEIGAKTIRSFEIELSTEEIDVLYRALHHFGIANSPMDSATCLAVKMRKRFNNIR